MSDRNIKSLVLRIKGDRMSAYKAAARKRKRPDGKPDSLFGFCTSTLDKAAGYTPDEQER